MRRRRGSHSALSFAREVLGHEAVMAGIWSVRLGLRDRNPPTDGSLGSSHRWCCSDGAKARLWPNFATGAHESARARHSFWNPLQSSRKFSATGMAATVSIPIIGSK